MLSERTAPPAAAPSADARLAHAFALLEDPSVRVVSFDVFDTLLFRRVPEPVDAFELLGERLLERGLLPARTRPKVFARLRVAAEQRARVRRLEADGGHEIVLAEIYAALARTRILGGEPDLATLAAAEIEVEGELLVVDRDVAALLEAARAAGKTTVAVSDTYFTEGEVVALLSPRVAPVDRVFTSSAHGAGKGGGLWPLVLDALGVRAREVVHVGDHEDADDRVPRGLGIRTVPFARRDEAFQAVLDRERGPRVVAHDGDFGLTALRGKVLHRRELEALPEELHPAWRYGAACLGPSLTGFAEWVQEVALSYGARRVHCLMREGAILAELVEQAGGQLQERVTAQPLWLSRQVLAPAAIHTGSVEELRTLLVRRSAPSVRALCRTLDLDAERVPALAPHARATLDDAAVRGEVLGTLASDPELRTHVLAFAAEMRARVLRLVERAHGDDTSPMVLVDLGWQATAQGLLDGILLAAGVPVHTVGLYLLTHAGAVERQLEGSEVRGFLGESGEPAHEVAALIRSPEILEQACMPDHGSQVGLTAELEPQLADQAEEASLQPAERRALQQGVRAFQREWGRYRWAPPDPWPSLVRGAQPLLRAQLVRAVTSPTGEEARLFSSWMHDENFGSTSSEAMTAGDARRALRHMDPRTLVELPMQLVYWPYGLAALHDEHLARAAELVALGVVPWDAFGSPLETGDIELRHDDGWGIDDRTLTRVEARRNRFGLSYVRARVEGEDVRVVRLDPASAPCVIRLDWLRARCHVRDGAPVELAYEAPADLARLDLRGLEWIGPKALLAPGDDPQIHLDVRRLAGETVYAVELSCALAVLPTLPPRPVEDPVARTKLAVRRRVRRLEVRTGLPLTPLIRRARGRLRRR